MNTSIKRLYEKTIGKEWAYDFDPDLAEKFAELIINECSNIAWQYCDISKISNGSLREIVADKIKQHFGVDQ